MQENQQIFFKDFSEFWKQNIFLFYIFLISWRKLGILNTGFVSLWYKNTNQY